MIEKNDEGMWNDYIDFKELEGETFIHIENKEDEIIFHTADKQSIRMYHEQDCCESVTIEDICGDLDDLLNSPIVWADESENNDENADESATWTFYRLGTNQGSVTIRWYGESNGYYSESVNLELV
jgi:hypothetical protein